MKKPHKVLFVLNIIFDIFELILFLGLLWVEFSGRLEYNPLVLIIIVGLFPAFYFFLTFAIGKKNNKHIQVMIAKVVLVMAMILFSKSFIHRYFILDQYAAEQYAFDIFLQHHSDETMTQFIDGSSEYEDFNPEDRYVTCRATITAEFEHDETKKKETYTEVIETKFDRKTGEFH